MKTPRPISKLINHFERLPGIGPKTAQRLVFYLLHFPTEEIEKFAEALIKFKSDTQLCNICKNVGESNPCEVCSDYSRQDTLIAVVASPLDVFALERAGFKGKYHVLHGLIDPLNNIGPEELYITELVRRLKNIVSASSYNSYDENSANSTFGSYGDNADYNNEISTDVDELDEFAQFLESEDSSQDAIDVDFTEQVPDSMPSKSPNNNTIELIMATSTSMEGESTAMYITKLLRESNLDASKVKITRIARGLPVGGDIEYADDVTLLRALEGRSSY